MRIIGGTWRSRKLTAPPEACTRPLPDRVRQALFSILGAYYGTPGELPPLAVADLFAGSGSNGLEAVSRGAARCTFYERDHRALAVLRRNLRDLAADSSCKVVPRDAWIAALDATPGGGPFDLVFLDPPYDDSRDASPRGKVRRWLSRKANLDATAPDALVVLHHEHRVEYSVENGEPWRIVDCRCYGSNVLTLFGRVSPVVLP